MCGKPCKSWSPSFYTISRRRRGKEEGDELHYLYAVYKDFENNVLGHAIIAEACKCETLAPYALLSVVLWSLRGYAHKSKNFSEMSSAIALIWSMGML